MTNNHATNKANHDVAIIGGGPAGLSAALTLSRAGKSSVVYDAGPPRNAASKATHGYLTRDHTPPRELRATAREELHSYGLSHVRGERVTAIAAASDGHLVLSDTGATRVRFVILAGGMVDELPLVDGLQDNWGEAVIHCPFCQGWERRGRPWALLALSEEDVRSAPRMLAWTDDLTLLVGHLPQPRDTSYDAVAAHGIAIDHRPPTAIVGGPEPDEVTVRFGTGDSLRLAALVVRPRQRQTRLVQSLELDVTPAGHLSTDAHGETSQPRIYAVGDIAGHHQAVLAAAASGLVTAQAVSHRLTLDALSRGERPSSRWQTNESAAASWQDSHLTLARRPDPPDPMVRLHVRPGPQ